MRQNRLAFLSVLAFSVMFIAPSAPLLAEESYIDQLARQVQRDIETGTVKDKVKEVKSDKPATTPAPARSQTDRATDQYHLARFFGTLLGPDEFSRDEFWDLDDESGDHVFGDSLRNPTFIDYFGTGYGRVIGSDTDYGKPMHVNDSILRDAINANDFSVIGQRLGELGYGQNFRIETQ